MYSFQLTDIYKLRGAFNKFQDFFVPVFKIVLKIQYVIAMHLMR